MNSPSESVPFEELLRRERPLIRRVLTNSVRLSGLCFPNDPVVVPATIVRMSAYLLRALELDPRWQLPQRVTQDRYDFAMLTALKMLTITMFDREGWAHFGVRGEVGDEHLYAAVMPEGHAVDMADMFVWDFSPTDRLLPVSAQLHILKRGAEIAREFWLEARQKLGKTPPPTDLPDGATIGGRMFMTVVGDAGCTIDLTAGEDVWNAAIARLQLEVPGIGTCTIQ